MKLIEGATQWLRRYAEEANLKAWVVGVSGGIDSTVVERLCEYTDLPTVAIAMPMRMHGESDREPLSNAMQLCAGRDNVDFRIRPIGPIWDAYRAAGIAVEGQNWELSQGNLRSRIRADILRDAAGEVGGCVVGTGNMDEDEIGYFTKGGDGNVDLCPLSKMHKAEVYAMAAKFKDVASDDKPAFWLAVPQDCLDTIPSANLWDGQTDEQELGMNYDEIAWAIEFKPTNADVLGIDHGSSKLTDREKYVLHRVNHMRAINAHKLAFPPIYDPEA
jgi:NAD+ synthase